MVPVKSLGLVNPEVISLSGQSSAPKMKGNPKSKRKEEKKEEEDPKPKPKVVKKVHMAPSVDKKRECKRIGKLQQAQRDGQKNSKKLRNWESDPSSGL